MKYSIIDETSNVLALKAKIDCSLYDYSKSVKCVSERFTQATYQLSEGEYLGWQLCFDRNGRYHSLAFSNRGANITKNDLMWIFQDCATVSRCSQDSFIDMFQETGKIYCLTCPADQRYKINRSLLKERFEYYKDLLAALKDFGIAVRIITSAENSGKGIILFSFPDEVTLRMKTVLSFVFVDMPLMEVDDESVLPESAQISTERISIGMQSLLETLYYEKPVEESIEDSDIDEFRAIDEDNDDFENDFSETEESSSDADDTTAIEELNLSVRAYNCLKRADINTIGQLRSMTYDDFTKIRNLGRKSKEEVIRKIEEYKSILPLPRIDRQKKVW